MPVLFGVCIVIENVSFSHCSFTITKQVFFFPQYSLGKSDERVQNINVVTTITELTKNVYQPSAGFKKSHCDDFCNRSVSAFIMVLSSSKLSSTFAAAIWPLRATSLGINSRVFFPTFDE